MPIDYLMTMDVSEAAKATVDLGFVGEAVVGWLYYAQQPGTTTLYRLNGPAGHFYTTSEAEQRELASIPGWTAETNAGFVLTAQAPGAAPLFRLLGPGGTHFYTCSATERDGLLLCPGWSLEGTIGYLLEAAGPPGTGELLRLWHNPVTPPPWTGMNPEQYGVSSMVIVNNSASPLVVTGHRGADLGQVQPGQVIAPFGAIEQVATFDAGESDHWDWLYLTDLGSPQRYQLYVESTTFGNLYACFGYYNSGSSEGAGNPSPFPPGVASAGWGANGQWTYTINTAPPLVQTDLQALTDHLGFLLVGQDLQWTASTRYDSRAHSELAPYLSDQVTAEAATEADYGAQSTWTITNGSTDARPGCYQNSQTAPVTPTYTYSYSRQQSFTLSFTETLSVSWKNSTSVGVPDDKTTVDWQVTVTVASTQSSTKTTTVTETKSYPIAIPAQTTVAWLVAFIDQNYSIPFTIPITLTGWVAIKSAQPVAAQVLAEAGATQVGTPDGLYLVLAPIGSLLQYCQAVSSSVASQPLTYLGASQASFAMAGVIQGGPVVVDNIDTLSYPAPVGSHPPACSSGLYPPPPLGAVPS